MRSWRWFAPFAILALVVAACTADGESPAPTDDGEPTATAAPTDDGDFTGLSYPEDGPAPCDDPSVNGAGLSQIRAVDEHTVEFTLCNPDAAFLSKIAFASFAIRDADWLEQAAGDGSIIERQNGTGPYVMDTWSRGSEIVYSRFEDYWGEPAIAQTLVFRWQTESAARFVELQAGTADGIDNVGPDDFEAVESEPDLTMYPREGLNTFYVGFTNTHEPFDNPDVRRAIAMGIDRQQIIDLFFPPESEVASHFTPCAIEYACEGDEWYEFDPEGARQLLADAGFPDGFETQIHYRDVVRGYLPTPGRVAQEIASQLEENLGITATVDEIESGTFIAEVSAGNLPGLHLLGWGADYPEVTNFLDFHFGGGASDQFGDKHDDIVSALTEGATNTDAEVRRDAYERANNAIRENIPMIPISHAGSATAFRADVEGAHSSPLGNEYMAVMDPGGRDTLVWVQNAEPISVYCADETDGESLRACEQSMESLYAYEVGGTEPIPALATECTPSDDELVWTCTLREGVTFHDGATFDANDVVVTYAVMWDAEHELHVGNTGEFYYWGGLWGGYLNPPAAE